MSALELWYRQPASVWTEALPIGNGRLGAMVFGGIREELLQLNESTFWSGGPYQPVNPEAKAHLPRVRELIFAGRYAEAEALANKTLMAVPHLQMSFQPIGDVRLRFDHAEPAVDYRRSLDLDRATVTTSYRVGDTVFTREAFASPADGIIALRLTASQKGAITLSLDLASLQAGAPLAATADTIGFLGKGPDENGIKGALDFAFKARLVPTGGTLAVVDGKLRLEGADEALILIDAATSFERFDAVGADPLAAIDRRLAAVAHRSADSLAEAHQQEHRRLFRSLAIDLGETPAASLPTDARIAGFATGNDPALAALYVQYGRYLMLASSRPGTQPANLQGIWNDLPQPPWGSKYTANINLQMNYWLPDPANLALCFEPLIAMVEDLAVTGATMAEAHYGAPGWMMHHNTDLWRATGPIDGAKWGLWPMGGAWLATQLHDHVDFAADDALLARIYPLMKGAAEFLLAVLVPLPATGELVTVPTLSPENVHPYGASLCAGPAMDSQITRELFRRTIAAAEALGVDADFRGKLAAALARLPADRIGHAGQLQEWLEDWDMQAPEMDHRHVSHLYALYPAQQIDLDTTPELAEAARRSLTIRGDEATGWGIGWRLNLWARLRDGDHAHDVLAMLLSPDRSYPNLFDAHPPFQIDGNFGGAAGILEMLVQSRPGEVLLLPALPTAWPRGRVSGIRARGGLTIDLAWQDGAPVSVTLTSTKAQEVRLRFRGEARVLSLAAETPQTIAWA